MIAKGLKYFTLLAVILLLSAINSCRKETLEERRAARVFELTVEVSSDSLGSYVEWLENMGTRFALADNRRDVAVAIMNRFSEFGIPEVQLDSFMISRTYRDVLYELWEYNVIATLTGSENPGDI